MKICTRVRLKRDDRGEFELDQTIGKNNIAENAVALGHDTHNVEAAHGSTVRECYTVFYYHYVYTKFSCLQ